MSGLTYQAEDDDRAARGDEGVSVGEDTLFGVLSWGTERLPELGFLA